MILSDATSCRNFKLKSFCSELNSIKIDVELGMPVLAHSWDPLQTNKAKKTISIHTWWTRPQTRLM